jgi:hypothetical protein
MPLIAVRTPPNITNHNAAVDKAVPSAADIAIQRWSLVRYGEARAAAQPVASAGRAP